MSQNQEIKNAHFNIANEPTKTAKDPNFIQQNINFQSSTGGNNAVMRGRRRVNGKMGRKDKSVRDKYLRRKWECGRFEWKKSCCS